MFYMTSGYLEKCRSSVADTDETHWVALIKLNLQLRKKQCFDVPFNKFASVFTA